MKMKKQPIVAFQQDEVGDWVAQLACGHGQHVRHNPPLSQRPWVNTAAGRAQFIGVLLPCKWCAAEEEGGPAAGDEVDSTR